MDQVIVSFLNQMQLPMSPIHCSLSGQDTRPSPERPGSESWQQNFLFYCNDVVGVMRQQSEDRYLWFNIWLRVTIAIENLLY